MAPRLPTRQLDDASFRALFAGSPIKRTGRNRLRPQCADRPRNSGDAGALPVIERLLEDPSPLVRGAAVWALARLADQGEIDRRRARHLPGEPDPDVRSEWESEAAVSPP